MQGGDRDVRLMVVRFANNRTCDIWSHTAHNRSMHPQTTVNLSITEVDPRIHADIGGEIMEDGEASYMFQSKVDIMRLAHTLQNCVGLRADY